MLMEPAEIPNGLKKYTELRKSRRDRNNREVGRPESESIAVSLEKADALITSSTGCIEVLKEDSRKITPTLGLTCLVLQWSHRKHNQKHRTAGTITEARTFLRRHLINVFTEERATVSIVKKHSKTENMEEDVYNLRKGPKVSATENEQEVQTTPSRKRKREADEEDFERARLDESEDEKPQMKEEDEMQDSDHYEEDFEQARMDESEDEKPQMKEEDEKQDSDHYEEDFEQARMDESEDEKPQMKEEDEKQDSDHYDRSLRSQH